MSNSIVVGISGAPVTERVVDWAIARAAQRHQKIDLVAVVGGAIGAVGEADVMLSAIDATGQLLEREAARISAKGIEVVTHVETGNPVSKLVDASEGAALLVIGSDYRGPGEGPARGAHGIRIAAAAHCPVVVVPDIDLGAERSGVVVGIDGSEVSEPALKFAAAEADRLGEPLIAVSVWTPLVAPRNDLAVYPELYMTNMQQATEEILALAVAGIASDYPDLKVIRKVEQGYPSHVINELAADAKMTVVGTRGRGAFARLLLGSISHEVLGRLAAVTAVVR
ncbi:universal stress protein [Microbacterium invictum]|uniref:Nucleotide-binding universal stress UspA family protein n=1 Tax=Microbacterium invictum TaxID=515415 RepID=A0AA40VM56_9MICO|nr:MULTISPECIES: universal stress protein [Microbacterium]MBB4140071.1 nucleotide-binding universal stress UspA family protein [Microbacterium invictum]